MQLLNDVDIYALLPETYQNVYTECISYALNQAIRLLIKYSNRIGVLYAVDQIPESVLDELAIEYDIKIYKQNADLQSKQRLIKNVLLNYMSAGTTKNVEYIIANIYGSVEIKEWFEYGGKPYHFKVITTGGQTQDDNSIKEFYDVIDSIKNVRSILDDVQVHYSVNSGLTHHSKNIKNIVKANVNAYDNIIVIGSKDDNILSGGTIIEPANNVIYCS